MLINLKTVHKPAALADAVKLLAAPGVYPLYGGVALQRRSSPAVEEAVSLAQLGLDTAQDGDNALVLGTMLTLEKARQACLARADAHPEARALAARFDQWQAHGVPEAALTPEPDQVARESYQPGQPWPTTPSGSAEPWPLLDRPGPH